MPAWIHSRADHIKRNNPDMEEGTAFAIATQQSHASGHTPSGYGTSKAKAKAKKKYDKPKKEYEHTADPKTAAMNWKSPAMLGAGALGAAGLGAAAMSAMPGQQQRMSQAIAPLRAGGGGGTNVLGSSAQRGIESQMRGQYGGGGYGRIVGPQGNILGYSGGQGHFNPQSAEAQGGLRQFYPEGSKYGQIKTAYLEGVYTALEKLGMPAPPIPSVATKLIDPTRQRAMTAMKKLQQGSHPSQLGVAPLSPNPSLRVMV